MRFTDEQQNALHAKGRVLVSAAAGSGKTAVLVEKVINLICDESNPVDIDKLLVVTYTNAAAAEMKTRISKLLSKKLKENPDSFHLKKQKLLLSSAQIGTIDSICINLAREHFYKLGIPCDFKIGDSSVLQRLKNDAVDEVLAEHFENNDEVFLQLLSAFGGERADDLLKQNILKVYEYLCTLPFPEEYIEKVIGIYTDFDDNSILFETVFDYVSDLVKSNMTMFKSAYDELLNEPVLLSGYGDAFAEINEKFKRALTFIEKRDYKGIKAMLDNYSNASLKHGGIKNYSDEDFRNRMKSSKSKAEKTFEKLKKVFNSSYEDVYNDVKLLLPLIEKFFALTTEFSERFYNSKLENNCFDFSDIEAEVLKLLAKRENNEIYYTSEAKELSKKYHLVFVDEYQDANDLQNTIFNALSDDGKKLFMVGDVKQSIYGFRKANPKNFLKARNELPPYEEGAQKSKVIMSGNFRSASEVCHFVNFIFYRLLSEKCGEMYYDKEDMLVPNAEFLPVDKNRVSLDIITATDSEFDSSVLQAYHIANIIKEKTNGEPIITEKNMLRPATYSDISILVRSRKEMLPLIEVFKIRGIPVLIDDNSGLLNEREIVTLFTLLQTIDNPYADVPLLATLTGDIYNFTADEIASIRAENKDIELYRALLKVKDKNQKVADFINEIDEFSKVASISSVSSLINSILTKTGYENTVFLYENGELCYNNLLLFKETAKTFEEGTQRGLSAFIAYIKRQIKNGNTMQKSAFISENDNAVRIMTMHHSKGLQFPICILANLNKKFNRMDSTANVLLTEKCGLGLNIVDDKRKIKYSTFPRNAAIIENNAISQSEDMRVLYVAMTRAKDFLIMVGSDNSLEKHIESIAEELLSDTTNRFNPYFVQNCGSFLDMLIAGALVHKDGASLRDLVGVSGVCNNEGDIKVNIISEVDTDEETEDALDDEKEFDEQRFEKICNDLSTTYPYKDLNKIFVKQSASGLAHKEISSDFEFSQLPLFMQSGKLTAAEKGTAMHKFMQYCDMNCAAKSISDEKQRLTNEGKLTVAEADSLIEENLSAFFESEIGKKVLINDKVYKEQGFMVELPAKAVYDDLGDEFDNEKVIVQGNADLCFFDENGLFIVDYKTDRADEQELIKRYKPQLDIYALALSQTFDCNISGTAIYSFYNKKLITL